MAIKDRDSKINNRKLRGEWAEICFMARATEQGLQVSRPWGEMARYDFVVEYEQRFVRVQVKSTICKTGRGYCCTVRGGHKPYVGDVFDFLAAYIVPENAWYIIPARELKGRGSVTLRPGYNRSEHEKYREAWDLLREAPGAGTVPNIHASADFAVWELDFASDWEGHEFTRAESTAIFIPPSALQPRGTAFPSLSTSNSLPPQLLHRNELLFGCG